MQECVLLRPDCHGTVGAGTRKGGETMQTIQITVLGETVQIQLEGAPTAWAQSFCLEYTQGGTLRLTCQLATGEPAPRILH